MAKSRASVLYGCRHPNLETEGGDLRAVEWAKLRAPNAWGQMKDGPAIIIWFNDFQAREDFHEVFGGLRVTLHRNPEQTHTGNKAMEILKQARFV